MTPPLTLVLDGVADDTEALNAVLRGETVTCDGEPLDGSGAIEFRGRTVRVTDTIDTTARPSNLPRALLFGCVIIAVKTDTWPSREHPIIRHGNATFPGCDTRWAE